MKLQDIAEMIASGYITEKDEIFSVLDAPDKRRVRELVKDFKKNYYTDKLAA